MFRDIKPYNILIIEDNPGDVALIGEYLEEWIKSPEIATANSFKNASRHIRENAEYDVILLDLSLPDKSGENLISEIVSLKPQCPVIVLTGHGDIGFSIKSLSLGIDDYLLKDDINATSLYKSIVYNIERKRTNKALEESESRYSSLFHLSPQPMWVYNPVDLMFLQVNKAAVAHYGYSEEEFLGMTILDIRPQEDAGRIIDIIKKHGEQTGANYSGRFRHIKKSGKQLDVEVYSNPVTLNNRIYQSVIAIDVTEKVQFENKMTRAILKAQEDERYEIGGELHDNVCQILATSQMSLSLLRDTLAPEALAWYAECRAGILTASKEIRNISHRLAPAFFDDSTFENSVRILFDTFSIAKAFNVTLNIDPVIEQHIVSRDMHLNLYRVIQEQLRNILKHAGASTIDIRLFVEHNHLKMQISDNGIGCDIKTVKKGIGMSNIKRRAELFSGSFKIVTSPGQGCTIEVAIPLQPI